MRQDFYVYIYYRLDGTPCYVGKGCGCRWKRHPSRRDSNSHLRNIILQAGGEIPRRKIVEDLTEAEAFAWERELIAEIGREAHGGPLVNLTDGGEGASGAIMPPEWRAHRSAKAKEAWQDPEFSRKQSERMRGNNFSVGHIKTPKFTALLSARMKGNANTLGFRHSDEAKAKMSTAGKGRKFSDERRAEVSARMRANPTMLGKSPSVETRRKIAEANKGKFVSLETRARISAAHKGKKKPPLSEAHKVALLASRVGKKHTAEAKEKVAASKRGKPLSAEHRAAISASKMGQSHPHTEESKAKIRAKALERAARKLEAAE